MVKKLKLPTSSPLRGKSSKQICLLELSTVGVNLDLGSTPANPIVGPEANQTGNSPRQTSPPGVVLDPRQCTPHLKPNADVKKTNLTKVNPFGQTCPPKLTRGMAPLDLRKTPNLKDQIGQTCPPELSLEDVILEPGYTPHPEPEAPTSLAKRECLGQTCPLKLKPSRFWPWIQDLNLTLNLRLKMLAKSVNVCVPSSRLHAHGSTILSCCQQMLPSY